jgi:hypothetical protein
MPIPGQNRLKINLPKRPKMRGFVLGFLLYYRGSSHDRRPGSAVEGCTVRSKNTCTGFFARFSPKFTWHVLLGSGRPNWRIGASQISPTLRRPARYTPHQARQLSFPVLGSVAEFISTKIFLQLNSPLPGDFSTISSNAGVPVVVIPRCPASDPLSRTCFGNSLAILWTVL